MGRVPCHRPGHRHGRHGGNDSPTVRLVSRSGKDMTLTYPELLQDLAARVPAADLPVVLDGEIVALDARGRPTSPPAAAPKPHQGG